MKKKSCSKSVIAALFLTTTACNSTSSSVQRLNALASQRVCPDTKESKALSSQEISSLKSAKIAAPDDPCTLDLSKTHGAIIEDAKDGESLPPSKLATITNGAYARDEVAQCQMVRSNSGTTSECTDFCDTFLPQSPIDKTKMLVIWAGWASFFPAAIRDSVEQVIKSKLAPQIGSGAAGVAAKGALCVPVVMSSLMAEVMDQERCQAGSQCVACGANAASRTTCRVWDAVRLCAQMTGVKIPVFSPTGVLARSCTLGTFLQRAAYRGICASQCQDSLAAAVPIATSKPVLQADGTVTHKKKCCRCRRKHRKDYWFDDPVIKEEFYYSVTADSNLPTEDCEGRNDKKYIYPADYFADGYAVYYEFSECEKYIEPAGVCPVSDGLKP